MCPLACLSVHWLETLPVRDVEINGPDKTENFGKKRKEKDFRDWSAAAPNLVETRHGHLTISLRLSWRVTHKWGETKLATKIDRREKRFKFSWQVEHFLSRFFSIREKNSNEKQQHCVNCLFSGGPIPADFLDIVYKNKIGNSFLINGAISLANWLSFGFSRPRLFFVFPAPI